jgi:hypothetical protein
MCYGLVSSLKWGFSCACLLFTKCMNCPSSCFISESSLGAVIGSGVGGPQYEMQSLISSDVYRSLITLAIHEDQIEVCILS